MVDWIIEDTVSDSFPHQAWSQKDFWKTTWQSSANLILLGILRSMSASLEDWNSHVKRLSPTHTRTVCLWGSKSPRKPMNQVTAFWIKSNSRDRIRPQMQIPPDTFPFLPRTPLTSSLHCISLPLSFSFCMYRRRKAGRKGWQHIWLQGEERDWHA